MTSPSAVYAQVRTKDACDRQMVVLRQSLSLTDKVSAAVYDSSGRLVASNETQERICKIAQGLGGADVRVIGACLARTELLTLLHAVHDPSMVFYIRELSENCPDAAVAYAEKYQAGASGHPTTIEAATWAEASLAASVALTAAEVLASGASGEVYALVRPPGHHAGQGFFGAYCFLNNAALAAQHLACNLGRTPAIIDIDYHAGDGTLDCLERSRNIAFASVHRSTEEAYPYCAELGPKRSGQWMFGIKGQVEESRYLTILDEALDRLVARRPDTLVVSIGFDIVDGDPHGGWSLQPRVFFEIARRLKETGLPLLFVQEGGYRTDILAECAAQLSQGLQNRKASHDELR